METVAFNDARATWADLCGLDAATLVAEDKARFLRAFNRTLRRGWEWHWWPGLMRCQERFFRAPYAAGTAYAAPTTSAASEVFFPATRKYYQALRATTGHAPATLSGGTYTLNTAYWAECAFNYTGPDWATGTDYLAGTVVRNPDDDRTYVCHTAHTSAASFDATQFGLLTPFVPAVGWTQTGQTAIGTVRECTDRDPRTNANRAQRVAWQPCELGVLCTAYNLPDRIWIEFRLRCPGFAEGATDVPAFLQDFAVGGAVIAFLEGEGQLEKALANDTGRLWSHLYDEADKLAPSFPSRPLRTRVANL